MPGSDVYLTNSEVCLTPGGRGGAGIPELATAVGMIEDAEAKGLLRPGGTVVEASSGRLGAALAAACAEKGYPFTCVTDPELPPGRRALLKSLGAHLVSVTRRDPGGGFLLSRIERVRELLTADPRLVWLNHYAYAAHSAARTARTAAEILRELGRVDHLFLTAGAFGALRGCLDHFREFSPHTKVTAVAATGHRVARRPPEPGRPLEPGRPAAADELLLVTGPEAVRMCGRLAADHGLAAGRPTGSVLAAVVRAAPSLPGGSRVLALAPDLRDRRARACGGGARAVRAVCSAVPPHPAAPHEETRS
ncbi:pyridoxal-phosphate dependent enzyme [Streptomyces sp. RS10V-4]|uniref:pyridoxal-phosphate dependent enzyme n=1 Tax=Streptomyces rhizoryzae TaxID=2932493 RepID=UPI002005F811|nr:pyridoxal-phosphate dependent enzyme [Streptomyces rhizoryzae]MCK7625310.1 pyridoxal-phosphate dependent enzyme [Streptomyces rhizoryzae]